MPILRDWDLLLDVDRVLGGQGADPASIRARRPQLVGAAERALVEGQPLLDPIVVYRQLAAESLRHERLKLAGGHTLSGSLIAQHLGSARQVVILLCTIGATLEKHSSQAMIDDPLYGLALDGLGSAAVESLATAACKHFEDKSGSEGMQTTIPLSPGMVGWPVKEGQLQIFALLEAAKAGITLTPSSMMIPRKSLSMVLGLGPDVSNKGRACDYCTMRETCRYRDHYG